MILVFKAKYNLTFAISRKERHYLYILITPLAGFRKFL
jgi:hypothetical protein